MKWEDCTEDKSHNRTKSEQEENYKVAFSMNYATTETTNSEDKGTYKRTFLRSS